MAKLGLEGLRRPVSGGLKALLEVSGLAESGRALVAGDVGFRLGPRINAAGRMDVARDVVELFTSKDPERWRTIAARLDLLNRERQNEEARIVNEIDAQLAAAPEWSSKYCLVLDGEGWHRGVVGIVASRVVEKTGRPALVIAKDGEEAHGSGRSITALHLLEALESCHDLFTRFGGHEHAVGFSLPSARLDELKYRLNKFAEEQLSQEDLVPEVKIDADIPLQWVTPQLRQSLNQLEPFGQGNPEPVFSSGGVSLTLVPQAIKEKHLKMRVSQRTVNGKSGFSYDAMGWRMATRLQNDVYQIGDQLDVAFRITVNEHPEFGGLELTLVDFKKSAEPAGPRADRDREPTGLLSP
jgi:single-stranded-DNA-specific exonuclease